MTIFAVLNTILQSRNRMTTSFVLMSALVVLDVFANAILVPRWHLQGAALATTIVAAVGAGGSALLVYRDIPAFVSLLSLLRMAGVAGLVFVVSSALHNLEVHVFVKCAGLSGLYFLLLWLSGEIDEGDFGRLRAALSRA
ncbi:MAG: hypothetical protein D6743_09690 [Calditrichaeota bacterium]|nr:MAG: hypothetical protein D6743_09690 [Calditrichota bacterium]